jgi:multidrug transporter EmrE-like cation transporter
MLSNISISILSPINSGLVMLLAIIYSVLIFKERFSALKLCGISLALLCILALAL